MSSAHSNGKKLESIDSSESTNARACIRVYASVYTRAHDPLFGGKSSEAVANLYKPDLLTWDRFAAIMQDKIFGNPQATVTPRDLTDKDSWKTIKLSQRISVFSAPVPGKAVHAIVFDYDNIEDLKDYTKLLECVASSPYECLLHTTSSHTEAQPKLHLIFPLQESVACSDICHCICALLDKLHLPTCFDSSVFLPGWSLYLPEERMSDGFCEWHKHDASGAELPKFSRSSCGSTKIRRAMLKRYHKYLGAVVDRLDTFELPLSVTKDELNPEIKKAAAARKAFRRGAGYFKAYRYRDIQKGPRLKLTKALDKLNLFVTQALYAVQHDYALDFLKEQPDFVDVSEYRGSSSFYSKSKKRVLLLSMPCPRCAQVWKKRIMFGGCYLDSGYTRMHCISKTCKHTITYDPYADKSRSSYQIDALHFWQLMLEQLHASVVTLKNTSVRFLVVGSTLVPMDLFCSTIRTTFQNRFRIRQVASTLPKYEVTVGDKYSVKKCTKQNIDSILESVPLLDDTEKKIANENIFVVRGNRLDFIYQRLLAGNLFPLLLGKMSGSTFATKKRLSPKVVLACLNVYGSKAQLARDPDTVPETSCSIAERHIPVSIRRQIIYGGITTILTDVLLSKLHRLPPAVFVTVEKHRGRNDLAKIRQYCMLAALRGTKVFIIPRISKGTFLEPAYRVCNMLHIKQTRARSVNACSRALRISNNFEKVTAKAAHVHFLETQDELLKLKKVNKPQKQDIEGDSHSNVESVGSTTALVKEAERSSANATSWGSLVIDL